MVIEFICHTNVVIKLIKIPPKKAFCWLFISIKASLNLLKDLFLSKTIMSYGKIKVKNIAKPMSKKK